MLSKNIVITALIFSFGIFGCTTERYAQKTRDHYSVVDSSKIMKVQDVVSLSKAGVSDSLIIGMMDGTNSWFKLNTQDVLDLRNAGVSEKVISAMMQQPSESTSQTNESHPVRYYMYPPYFWYYDYPYWYYPSFSIRFGHGFYHHGFAHRGRIR